MVFNADGAGRGAVVVENHTADFCFKEEVEVRVGSGLEERVEVAMCCILTFSVFADVSIPSLSYSQNI